MTPSTFPGLRIVLFPHVAGSFVLLEDVVDDVRSQLGIYLLCLLLIWPLYSSIFLITV